MRVLNNKAAVNLLIILILMKLALLTALSQAGHIVIYKKIFDNEQNLYKNQLNLYQKLIRAINVLDPRLKPLEFLADDLSLINENLISSSIKSGINIYQINIDEQLYAYYGKRYNQEINLDWMQEQIKYYKQQLATKHNIIAHNINVISLLNNKEPDQIFFFDEQNVLRRYDLKTDLILPGFNFNNIDYIIGPHLTDYANAFRVNIYLLSRENQQSIVRLITLERNSFKLDLILKMDPQYKISKIFLRCNNLIFLDPKLEPQIYKLEYKNKLLITKVNTNFKITKSTLINYQDRYNLPKYELFWNSIFNMHQAIIINHDGEIITYEFNLPTDNGILSFRTSDY